MSGSYSVHITTINGKKFASGLYWQPLTRPRAYMKEAKEIGRQRGLDIVAIRKSETVIQAGFVSKADGAYKGMYSLAAALAGQLGDTWLGVFKLPDGMYALVGVLRGGIIPGADMVGDKATIAAALRSIYAYKHGIANEHIYAPEEMSFGGKEIDIEKILTPVSMRKEYLLKPLALSLTKKEIVSIALAVAIAVIGTGGYMKWEAAEAKRKHDAEVQAAKIKMAEIEALNAKSRAEQNAKSIVKPWAIMPTIKDIVSACKEQIGAFKIYENGWIFESAKCDMNNAAAIYSRKDNATLDGFGRAVKKSGFENNPVFFGEGEKASVFKSISTKLSGDQEIIQAEDVLIMVTSHLQKIGINPTITEVKIIQEPVAALPGQNPAEVIQPPTPEWKKYEFTFYSSYPPEIISKDFPEIGVRITEISNLLKGQSFEWAIKGEIYAK